MPEPYLAGPEVLAAWERPERYFDAHTHFFNARDVPVAAFLAKSVAHSIESEKARQLLISLAPIAEALSQMAPSPKMEMDDLCRRSGLKSLSLVEVSRELDDQIEAHSNAVAVELYKAILQRGNDIPRLINEAMSRARAAQSERLRQQPSTFSLQFVQTAVRDGGALRDPTTNTLLMRGRSAMPPEEAEVLDLRSTFQFVRFMLSPRHHNLRTYIKRYAEYSPAVPLSGCFAAMVDFNYWLDCPAKASHVEDQMHLHEQLALLSRGFLLPLVAYNPWVDIMEQDASIRLVEQAIKNHGFIGVKIYPPMGFYPYGNAENPLEGSAESRPDLRKLDEKLAAFFELCESLGTAVIAHASESNGRDRWHDVLAGPRGWRQLRDGPVKLQSLFVNTGHFGGDVEGPGKGDWTDSFVDLMGSEGGLRVYGDLGYWDRLLDNENVQKKLARVLQVPIPGGPTVADRILYGSDWLMLSQVPSWEQYANGIAAILKRLDPSGAVARKVLGANAVQCFGLAQGMKRGVYERLLDYYAQSNVTPAPGWAFGGMALPPSDHPG